MGRVENPEQPFADFEARVVVIAIEYTLLLYLTVPVQNYVLEPLGLLALSNQMVLFVLAMTYYTLSWAGPLQATPIQFLFQMRVLDVHGEQLSIVTAALRSLLLIVAVVGATTLFRIPENPLFAFLAFPVIALLFIAALTPNRQAAHDYLAGSIVVKRFSVKSSEDRNRLSKLVADKPSRANRKPTFKRILSALVVTGFPVIILYNFALMQFDRELRSRIGYAIGETAGLRAALEEFYLYEDRWSTSELELGHPTRAAYPDGGFYELEEDGVIRIRFTVIPKLKKISITLTPENVDERYEWRCRSAGDIPQALLPSACRNY